MMEQGDSSVAVRRQGLPASVVPREGSCYMYKIIEEHNSDYITSRKFPLSAYFEISFNLSALPVAFLVVT
jgi:hypothetical protein